MVVSDFVKVAQRFDDPHLKCVIENMLNEEVVVNCRGERFILNGINITAEGTKNPTIFLEIERDETSNKV